MSGKGKNTPGIVLTKEGGKIKKDIFEKKKLGGFPGGQGGKNSNPADRGWRE